MLPGRAYQGESDETPIELTLVFDSGRTVILTGRALEEWKIGYTKGVFSFHQLLTMQQQQVTADVEEISQEVSSPSQGEVAVVTGNLKKAIEDAAKT